MKIANTCRELRDSLIVAFSMYSKIPMPRTDWTDHSMKYSMCFFPWIGWVIGILEALWLYLSFLAGFSALFRAAVFTVLPVLVTGGIHLDGYLDTSDAMSSWREREKRLEILKDSQTFGNRRGAVVSGSAASSRSIWNQPQLFRYLSRLLSACQSFGNSGGVRRPRR